MIDPSVYVRTGEKAQDDDVGFVGYSGGTKVGWSGFDCPAEGFWEGHAQARADTLFHNKRVSDPFKEVGRIDAPFELRPSLFLRNAVERAPHNPGQTVSEFADWVYSLYRRSVKDPEALAAGTRAESAVFEERLSCITEPEFAATKSFEWRLIHSGLRAAGRERPEIFEIPGLTIDGIAIRGCPDLIYENPKLRRMVVVEIKFTRKQIPSNLWPNVWAQLWAYSKIPLIKDCPSVNLIGEVWGANSRWPERNSLPSGIYLRKSVGGNPLGAGFERFFSTLFSIYRGDYT